MPGSTAETMFGRRGGGWLPKTTAHEPPAPPRPTTDPDCRTCGAPYSAHTGRLCRACNTPIEHHTPEYEAACWEGRARMAAAKIAAGGEPNAVDTEALERITR